MLLSGSGLDAGLSLFAKWTPPGDREDRRGAIMSIDASILKRGDVIVVRNASQPSLRRYVTVEEDGVLPASDRWQPGDVPKAEEWARGVTATTGGRVHRVGEN
jgi:hypothetical protein